MKANGMWAAFLAVLVCGAAGAGEILPGLEIVGNGVVRFPDVQMQVIHYDGQWGGIRQDALRPAAGFPKIAEDSYELEGILPAKNGKEEFRFTQAVKKDGDGAELSITLASEAGVESKALAYALFLPIDSFSGKALTVDGKEVTLPQAHGGQEIFSGKEVRSLHIPLEDGVLEITGAFGLYVQDDRQWNGNTFQVRLSFTPGSGLLKSSALKLRLRR